MHDTIMSRRRTRSQWEEYYKNWHKEMKGNGNGKDEGESIGGGDKGAKSVVDSESGVGNDNVASIRALRVNEKKKKKKKKKKKSGDSDGDVEYLGEEVVSNGSSLKIVPESGSGCALNIGNQDGGDLYHSPLLAVTSSDSGNSDTDVSRSEESPLSSSESTSTSDDEEDHSDEDYEAHESSTSSDSEDSYYDEQETANENGSPFKRKVISSTIIENNIALCTHRKGRGMRMTDKKENNSKQVEDGKSDEGCHEDEKDELPSVFQSSGKKEIYVEQASNEAYHGAHNHCGHKKTRDYKKKEDTVRIGKYEFFILCKNAGIDEEKVDKLVGLSTIYEPCSSSACVDKTSMDRDSIDPSRIHNVSKEVNNNANESDRLKRRKVLGSENSDASNEADITLASQRHPCTTFKFQKQEPEFGNNGSSILGRGEFFPSKDYEFESLRDRDSCCVEREKYSRKVLKLGKKFRKGNNFDLTKILIKSINSLKEECPIDNDLTQETLPLKFRFDVKVHPLPEKSEWEKEMDLLFCDLELGLCESEIDSRGFPVTEDDVHDTPGFEESPAALCCRGEHWPILDEQIGIVCKCCGVVILDIKYVLPDFHTPPLGRRDRMNFDKLPDSIIGPLWHQDSAGGNPNSINCVEGTVWDLMGGGEKEMYPHQRQGFEFMWKNLAGDIRLEKLKQPLSYEGRGCIISHAPGTGKTRMTIMFLLTFLKLYPTCRPVIIAPRGMLLTWEAEFIKWHVNIPFHNLNKKELCGYENAVATNIIGQVGGGAISRDHIRLLKLYSWMRGRSILGLSYQLFEKLAGENGKGKIQHIRKILLELPGLLVLDEGHTPRNNQSRLWNALMEVATHRRIILSGTPFQNNLTELHNTLCLVDPKFVNEIGSEHNSSGCKTPGQKSDVARKRWMELTSSIGRNEVDRLMKLKRMLKPFIHVHKGHILEERLPGLSECLVFLHPTELQKTLMETASKADLFHRIQLVSLISVHPSLMLERRLFSMHKSELEKIESDDDDAGVKTKFVMHLIMLATAVGERVLIFSQFIDPLVFIKKRIISFFSWNEGREVLYMDGKFDEKQRQESILSFNDDKSEAKVLLASERACSEGISLVGASRVVLLDTVWNPSVEKQAISRAFRLGQKKVVYVYHLFTSGTEVRQYAQQVQKERISQLIVSPIDGETCVHNTSPMVPEDKVLEAMLNLKAFCHNFEKVIHQPKESDVIEIFGLMDQK